MTAPRSAGSLATVRGAQAAPVESPDAVAAVAFWHAPISKRDAITLSARAAALVRAGLAVRAYVMLAWEGVRQAVTLASGRTIIFENGLYW